MTYLRNIILPFMLALAFAGCTQDEAETVMPDEIKITLNVSAMDTPGEISSKSTTPEPGESTMKNLYIMFYPMGTYDEPPVFFYSETGEIDGSTWSKTFKTTEMPKLAPHTEYNVVVLANIVTTAILAEITENTTLGDLESVKLIWNIETQSDPWTIPFTNYVYDRNTYITYTTGRLGELKIDLKRMVSRLDIFIDNQISAQNLQLVMARESPAIAFPALLVGASFNNTPRPATVISEGYYRFYLFPVPGQDSDPVRIYLKGMTSAGKPIFHMIDVMPNGSTEIKRNCIYKLTLTLKEDSQTKASKLITQPLVYEGSDSLQQIN